MNIGGYDENAFNEVDGNDLLNLFLRSKKTIFPHFNTGDRGPNFDGYFELLEKNSSKFVPIGKFEVQIKTLNHDYTNNNKDNTSQYKYSCESKIFNAVKKGLTTDPCYLFLVDVNNSKFFAIYIDFEYVVKLNISNEKNKTIYFNDTDEIKDIDIFYATAHKILLDKKQQNKLLEKNKFTTTGNLTFDETKALQNEFDYINNVFENELLYIKKSLFSDVWKFGLAYMKESGSIGIGIYYIYRGKNGEFIRKLDIDSFKFCTFITINKNNNIRYHINSFIKSVLKKCFKLNIIPFDCVSDEILFEICFSFLDEITKIYKKVEDPDKIGCYYKNSEHIEIIKKYYFALELYTKNKFGNSFENILNENQSTLFVSDPLNEVFSGRNLNENQKKLVDCFESVNSLENISFNPNVLLRGNYPYNTIKQAIIELNNRNIKIIDRLWLTKNWNDYNERFKRRERFKIENGYSLRDYFNNLEKLILVLPNQYNNLIDKFKNCNLQLNKKYVYALSNDGDFKVRYVVSSTVGFYTEIDNKLIDLSYDEIFENTKLKNISISTMINGYTFNNKFPLLSHINYIFITRLCEFYNLGDIDLDTRDLIIK